MAAASRINHDRDRLRELVDWLEDEYGSVTDSEEAAAYRELDEIDAEHARRRATQAG